MTTSEESLTLSGVVIDTRVEDEAVFITMRGDNCPTPVILQLEFCAEARCISEGDDVWWDRKTCYWTPRAAKKNRNMPRDYPIPRAAGQSLSLSKQA
jgi:hypothetical protein